MNSERMKLDEMYPGTDAATKRELEVVANAIGEFRAAVHHIAARETESQLDWGFGPALKRRHAAQRRLMLEWAVAAVLCVAALIPAVGYYRHAATLKAEQQAQMLKQREADAALLEQVSSEISEAVPDAMRPLVEVDVAYTNAQQKGENSGRNE
jgi:hypothetical protein